MIKDSFYYLSDQSYLTDPIRFISCLLRGYKYVRVNTRNEIAFVKISREMRERNDP